MTDNTEFTYMLLNRLQSDYYRHRSYGRALWGINLKDHVAKMVELWNSLNVKPEWLTSQELQQIQDSIRK